jgi:6-phosphogluconolactonase
MKAALKRAEGRFEISEAGDAGMRLHVGTYADAGGTGLYPLACASGEWTLGEAYRPAPNASFGVCSVRFGLHYLVDEREEGALRVLRRAGGAWQPLARLPTQGSQPCHVALSPDEAWLAVANYGSGSVALFPLDPQTGLPGDPVVRANHGRGPVTDRQDGPHAHCAAFAPDGKWLYQTDLGADEVLAFGFDRTRGPSGERKVALAAPAGSGPRHLLFHPHRPLALLVSELASDLTVLDVGDGALSVRQSVSTLPAGYRGESLGGHLAINAAGDRVYVSNRGHDSIAVFALDDGGEVSLLQHVSAGGASPRFFLLCEARGLMLAANEEGNSVTLFAIMADGTLAQRGGIDVPAPAFLFEA